LKEYLLAVFSFFSQAHPIWLPFLLKHDLKRSLAVNMVRQWLKTLGSTSKYTHHQFIPNHPLLFLTKWFFPMQQQQQQQQQQQALFA